MQSGASISHNAQITVSTFFYFGDRTTKSGDGIHALEHRGLNGSWVCHKCYKGSCSYCCCSSKINTIQKYLFLCIFFILETILVIEQMLPLHEVLKCFRLGLWNQEGSEQLGRAQMWESGRMIPYMILQFCFIGIWAFQFLTQCHRSSR